MARIFNFLKSNYYVFIILGILFLIGLLINYKVKAENTENKESITFQLENKNEFFEYIDKLRVEKKYIECIKLLESIPNEKRDYQTSYQIASSYQNLAIIDDDNKEVFIKALLKSIEILNSIKEEGKEKAEWNKLMVQGYIHLADYEKALPYAIKWLELDPDNENALEFVNKCKDKIKKRKSILSISNDRDILEETSKIDDNWGVYMPELFAYNLPALIRVNLGVINFNNIFNYPKRLTIQILYKDSDDNGFPTIEESKKIYPIEEAIGEIIKKYGGICAGVIKFDECVHIIVYTKDESIYVNEISKMMSEKFPDYVYLFATVDDKEWQMYFNVLFPNKYEYQSIENMKIINVLRKNNDTMVARDIEHFLYFKTEENRKAFLNKVMLLGFKNQELENDENNESIDSDSEYPYQLMIVRKDDFQNIDDIVWYLMELAEEFDGEYDGWECNIIRE